MGFGIGEMAWGAVASKKGGDAPAAVAGPVAMQVREGQKSKDAQGAALSSQEKAQAEARALILRQRKESEMAMNKANQKTPNISAILAAAQGSIKPSTMMTGLNGIDTSKLSLGRTTLLGT